LTHRGQFAIQNAERLFRGVLLPVDATERAGGNFVRHQFFVHALGDVVEHFLPVRPQVIQANAAAFARRGEVE
jgi:hypothetical protein